MKPEPDLITAARRGERPALEQLLVAHLGPLEAFVRLRMGAALRAKLCEGDLVQSVCREVLEDLSAFEYRGDAAFRHWLYTRAENKLKEKHRYHSAAKRSSLREQQQDFENSTFMPIYQHMVTPSRLLAAKEAIAAIEKAFDELPEDYREAVSLHRICGFSHAEIAERMQRSEGAVRNLVYRGLSRLALRVDELERGSTPP